MGIIGISWEDVPEEDRPEELQRKKSRKKQSVVITQAEQRSLQSILYNEMALMSRLPDFQKTEQRYVVCKKLTDIMAITQEDLLVEEFTD